MLRTLLFVAGLVLLAVGLGARWAGHPGATPAAIWGAVLMLAVLIERWRYRPRSSTEVEWLKTDEQFIDPESGRAVQVFYNPRTGERRYDSASTESGGSF